MLTCFLVSLLFVMLYLSKCGYYDSCQSHPYLHSPWNLTVAPRSMFLFFKGGFGDFELMHCLYASARPACVPISAVSLFFFPPCRKSTGGI